MPKVISNYHWRETDYAKPDWSEEEEECFSYRGEVYFLSEFVRVHANPWVVNPPAWLCAWDGYHGDSFFSGILVRYQKDIDSCWPDWYPEREDCIQVATYIS